MKTILILAQIVLSIHGLEKAKDWIGKKNKQDELLPTFNILGFTDLDILDFATGAAERSFGYDVRRNWHHCFKTFTPKYVKSRIDTIGLFSFGFTFLETFITGSTDNVLYEDIMPSQCKQMADEIHQMLNFLRQDLNPMEQVTIVWDMFADIMGEGSDFLDIFKRLAIHDFYDMGKDFADFMILLLDNQTSDLSDDDIKELPIDK